MNKELLFQEKPLSVFIAPEIIVSNEEFEFEQRFIDECLTSIPSEAVEDVSSEVHETNRIPDPRILIIDDEKILRLDKKLVDDSIEKTSYLGKLEYEAFEKIKYWSAKNEEGVEIWFSPSFEGVYPVEKIDIGEIRHASDGTKVLLKKAILLDIEKDGFLDIANNFALSIGYEKFVSSEKLRSEPVFCTHNEMKFLLSSISGLTNQIEMIASGEDLKKKTETYERLSIHQKIYYSTNHYYRSEYHYIRERAEEERMMGKNSVSCPSSKTAFQSFSGDYRGETRTDEAYFECPRCHGLIKSGLGITTCPHCGLTKEQAGSTCG